MRILKWTRNIFSVVFLVGICVAGLVFFQGYRLYREALSQTSLKERVEQVRAQEDFTPADQMPQFYLDAVVAVEDHRFFQHGGFDILATGRALWNDIKTLSFEEGGSTITQQLAKNLYFTQEKELTRKVAEVLVAFDLEKNYSKQEILELYLNSIYFGNGCYTAAAASRSYFGKEPAEMTEYESTLLAGIPNAPSVYDLTQNPDLAGQRQKQVVAMMVKHEYLDQSRAKALFS